LSLIQILNKVYVRRAVYCTSYITPDIVILVILVGLRQRYTLCVCSIAITY